MIRIQPINAVAVTSEPSDHTRYDYILIKNDNEYICVNRYSTFVFPLRVLTYVAETIITLEDAITNCGITDEYATINPYTLLEVCRTINILENDTKRSII